MTGPELRAERHKYRLSVPFLAEAVGLSRSSVYNLERDRGETSRRHVQRILDYFGSLDVLTESHGLRLRQLRREKGYRLTDLEAQVFISDRTIRRIEGGIFASNSGWYWRQCMEFLLTAKPKANLRLNGRKED